MRDIPCFETVLAIRIAEALKASNNRFLTEYKSIEIKPNSPEGLAILSVVSNNGRKFKVTVFET